MRAFKIWLLSTAIPLCAVHAQAWTGEYSTSGSGMTQSFEIAIGGGEVRVTTVATTAYGQQTVVLVARLSDLDLASASSFKDDHPTVVIRCRDDAACVAADRTRRGMGADYHEDTKWISLPVRNAAAAEDLLRAIRPPRTNALALGALSAQGSASPIQNGDTAAVERAVAEYTARVLLARIPPGALAFDSRDENGDERSTERLRNLESILGGKATHEEAVIVCDKQSRSCHMNGYTRFVRLRIESLMDSTASATVTLQWPSGTPRMPIYLHEPVLLFAKHNNTWEFERLVAVRDT
jgi:hypothetical protein